MSSYQDNDQSDFPLESNMDPGAPAVDRDGARRHPRNDAYEDDGGDQGRYYDDFADDDNEYYEDDPRRRNNERGEYADDGCDDRYDDDDGPYEEGDFFEEDFDDDERERKARDMAKKRRKPTKVYEVEDGIDREDLDDGYGPENAGMTRRDYWGRERKNCCDCIRLCCLSCCRGFRTPPACEPRRLCECPHGWCYTTMGVILGISGLVMCVFYIISCDIERITILYNGEKPPDAPRIGYGFISRGTTFEEAPDYMSCIYYSDEEKAGVFDIWMHSARFFLFFSTVLGIIGAVVLFTAICVAWSPNTFEHWLMWLYIIAGLTVPFSYLLFGSPLCDDNECKLGQGGVQCISIFLFWLCCANTVKSFPTALPPRRDEDDDAYNGEEDDDDLYYETEEDMWNDRRPPKREMDEIGTDRSRSQNPYTMDPQYSDDYAEYDDEGNGNSNSEGRFVGDNDEDNRSNRNGMGGQPEYYYDADGHNNINDHGRHNPLHADDESTSNSGRQQQDPWNHSSSQASRTRVGDEDGPTIT